LLDQFARIAALLSGGLRKPGFDFGRELYFHDTESTGKTLCGARADRSAAPRFRSRGLGHLAGSSKSPLPGRRSKLTLWNAQGVLHVVYSHSDSLPACG
jgi:hypothetical protein